MSVRLSRRDLLRAASLSAIAGPLAAPTLGDALPSNWVSTSETAAAGTTAELTLREKIGRLLLVGFNGASTARAAAVAQAIAAGEVGGVVLFGRNIVSPVQVANLTAGLTALAPADGPLLVATDQEGGQVQRLGPADGFRAVPSQATMAGHRSSYVRDIYRAMAADLAAAGINLNLAPVVDLNVNPRNPAIGALGRSFSANPSLVAALARIEIEAHRQGRVLTTLKHFPGLGSASANTDFSAVVDVTDTWSESELVPYQALVASRDVDCVMVGHTLNRNLDRRRPASLSATTVDGLLRNDIGWQGPVMSDDLQAAAIAEQYSRDQAVAAALNAGVDLLLFSRPPAGGYGALVSSIVNLVTAGVVDEARIDRSVERVATLRTRVGGPPVKFIQLSGADLAGLATIALPAGTAIEDFTGQRWATVGPTRVRVLPGLVNAHGNRRVVVISTARFYEDGIARPTAQVAVLG